MLTIQLLETDWEKVQAFLQAENIGFQSMPCSGIKRVKNLIFDKGEYFFFILL